MDTSINHLRESVARTDLKEQIRKERNWGDPTDNYLPKYSEFKQTKEHRELLKKLKNEWKKARA